MAKTKWEKKKKKVKCILWTDGSKIILFGSRDHIQFVRQPLFTEFKPQYPEDSGARWRKHPVSHTLVSGLFITY